MNLVVLVSLNSDVSDIWERTRFGRPHAAPHVLGRAQGRSKLPLTDFSEWVTAFRTAWLGGRDSNPDNGVQSAVSYR